MWQNIGREQNVSVQKNMQAGLAFGIVLVIGMLVVSSFWAMIAGVIETSPITILTNLLLLVAFILVLGWFLQSKWYRNRVRVNP